MTRSKILSVLTSFAVILLLIILQPIEINAQGKGKNKSKVAKKEVGPPPWAPAHGYRTKTRYVYFSDYNVYYDNTRGVYISVAGSNWQIDAKLPNILSGVDLNAAVKVDLDFSGDEPQRYNKDHKNNFGKQ